MRARHIEQCDQYRAKPMKELEIGDSEGLIFSLSVSAEPVNMCVCVCAVLWCCSHIFSSFPADLSATLCHNMGMVAVGNPLDFMSPHGE